MKTYIAALFAILVIGSTSWASLSIFESSSESVFDQGRMFEGKVKSIAVDQDVRVRLVGANDQSLSLSLCLDSGSLGARAHLVREETMNQIRSAMTSGRTLRVAASGVFDQCIKKVETVY